MIKAVNWAHGHVAVDNGGTNNLGCTPGGRQVDEFPPGGRIAVTR